MKTRSSIILSLIIVMTLALAMPAQLVQAAGSVVLVDNLQPSFIAPGGVGVYSAYYTGPYNSRTTVSPGTTAVYDGREAGIIKAGLVVAEPWDEGLLGFQVPNVDVSTFAGQILTFDVQNETGANPVWVRIRLTDANQTQYQFVPTTNPATWHTVDAATGQHWQLMDVNGNATGPMMTLTEVATANPGLAVDRVYLTLGQGGSYNVSPGVGTVAWVDKVTIDEVTYDFVVPTYWYVATTGADTNEGTAASPFLTIQHAIDSASAGDTIHVAAGTYVEQVVIAKNVTVKGAGTTTVIQAPDTVPTCFTTSSGAKHPVVCIKGNADATLDSVTVDGAGKGNANYQFVGVAFHNAGGTLKNSAIKDIRDTPFSGNQHGVGIYSYNEDDVARTINVWDNVITGFQKNGMALNAGDTTPLVVDVRRNQVTGAGPTPVTAQNGIQVWANLGTGTVADNTVAGIAYSGSGWVATSILDFYADLTISGNTISNAHTGIYVIDGAGQITNNTLSIIKTAGYGYGIIATDPPQAQPSPYEPVTASTHMLNGLQAPSALLNVTVTNNEVTFSGPDNTATYGIEADGGYGLDDLALTIANNLVSGFSVGVELYACETGCSSGAITSATANGNSVAGNTIGMRSNLGFTVDAEKNWWGAASGPGSVGSGTGSQVSAGIDYTPWCINAACTAFNPIIIPPAMPPADVQSVINLAAPGTTLIFEPGIFLTPVGGYIITQPGLTFQFSPGTIIKPSSPCFTVLANDTTLSGGVCEPSSGSDGILTGAALNNFVIKNMEIRNGTGTGDGIHLGHDITNLQIVDNYIHNMGGDGVEYASGTTVSGVHEVQGNLFQLNVGSGINNASESSYVVKYNSWNDIAGPTGPNGDGAAGSLDYTPWTHIGLSMISSGSPVLNKVAAGAQIVYTIRMDASEVYGADFKLAFGQTKLSVVSITDGGLFSHQDPLCSLSSVSSANSSGVISFCGSRTSALNGTAQTVFQVTFQGVAEGVVQLDLDETSDSFGMVPPAGASTNIYAAALTDGSVEVFGAFNVTGRIDLQGRANDSGAVMTFAVGTNQGYGPYAFGASDYWGSISRTGVTADTYNITVSMPRYLPVTIASSRGVAISADRVLSTLTLLGGDADNSGAIGLGDATIIGGLYGTAGDSAGDINADSVVNILDLALMGGNYEKTSATAYAGWTP